MSNKTIRLSLIAGLILLAAISRVLPHPHNFTPVGAIALFGAAYFPRKWMAFAVPLVAMWLSDLFINNVVYAHQYPQYYQGFQWLGSPSVYGAFLLIVLLGLVTLRQVKVWRVVGSALAASIIFYIVTNFAVWHGSSTYPASWAGLSACYVAALPFFGNTLLGDLVYSGVLFGVFAWFTRRYPTLASV